MGIEYFQEKWSFPSERGSSDTAFSYRAFGPDKGDGTVPYAELSGYHQRTKYAPTFDENNPDMGGRSREFLQHKYDTLMRKSWESPLSEEEGSAVEATRHFLLRNQQREPEKTPEAQRQLDTNPHLSADKLFEETSPARIKITGMFSDPSMKSAAVTLAGMAYEQHNRDPIVSSADLSSYSSRLVQNAMSRGMPVTGDRENPGAEQTNSIDLTPRETSVQWVRENYSQRPDVRRSTPEQVSRGRGVVREMLRGNKKRNTQPATGSLSDQFLPGMEKYA